MNDKQLQQHVMDELDFEPSIDSADIGVLAEDGVVTLTGHVPNYAQKLAAERAAWRIKGVKAVVQSIVVRPTGDPASDEEIAKRAVQRLQLDSSIPADSIRVTASKGWLILEGQVTWQFQRANAEQALRNLIGVTGITNNIALKPMARTLDLQHRIENALRRCAEVEAGKVTVKIKNDGEVILEGAVDTWSQRRAIENAVWSAPGVCAVKDLIAIA